MPRYLSQEEIVTIQVLAERGQNHCEIGRTVGVTESTVRWTGWLRTARRCCLWVSGRIR
jgi:hypothetical protein